MALVNLKHCTHLIGVQKSVKSADFFDTVILSLYCYIEYSKQLNHLGKVWSVLWINLKPRRLLLVCILLESFENFRSTPITTLMFLLALAIIYIGIATWGDQGGISPLLFLVPVLIKYWDTLIEQSVTLMKHTD